MDHEAAHEQQRVAPVAAPDLTAQPLAAPALSAAASGMGNAAFGATVARRARRPPAEPGPRAAASADDPVALALARTVAARRPTPAPLAIARDWLDDAGQREVDNRKAATGASAAMQVTNVNDVASARRLLAKLEADEPNMQLALTQSTEWSAPGETSQKDRISKEASLNLKVMSDLRTYLASAGVQGVAIGQYQQMLAKTFEDFDRLEGVMGVLTGSNLTAPDQQPGVRQGQTSVNGGDATGGTPSGTGVNDANAIAAGANMAAEFEELKQGDKKLAELLEAAEGPDGAKAGMKIAAGRLQTAQANALATSAEVHADTRTLSGALAAIQAVEIKGKYDAKKKQADEVAGYVSDVLAIAQDVAVAYATAGTAPGAGGGLGAGLPAAGNAAAQGVKAKGLARVKAELSKKFDQFLEAANKAAGDFPDHSDLVAGKEQEKARIETAKGAAARLKSSKDKLKPHLEAVNTEVAALEQAKTAYDKAMKAVGEHLDAKVKAGGKGGANAQRFSQVIKLIREGEQFLLQADQTRQLGVKELGSGESSRAKQASADLRAFHEGGEGQSGRGYFEPYSWKKTKVEIGPDGKPKEVDAKHEVDDETTGRKKEESIVFWDTRPVRVRITTALNPNVYFDDGPSEATGVGSAESHRTKDGTVTNKGANDTIAKSIEQVGQMHTRVQGYVTTLRTMSIGGAAGTE